MPKDINSKKKRPSTVVRGVIASEAIDTSGEVLDIRGVDMSSFETVEGIQLNREHVGAKGDDGSFRNVVGKMTAYKKVFSEKDCEDDFQLQKWKELQVPFIDAHFRLFDGAGHDEAIALAAIFRDAADHEEVSSIGFSIEGSTVKREGNRLLTSICRAIAATGAPANKSATATLVQEVPEVEDPLTKLQPTRKFEDPTRRRLSSISGHFEIVSDSLAKTIAAGSYDAAPASLTGGAALQREWLSNKTLKNKSLQAVRDFDGTDKKEFKKFLKHQLPEADDEYIEYFTDLVDDVMVKKSQFIDSQLAKSEPLAKNDNLLAPLPPPVPPPGSVRFKDKFVNPGEIEFVSGVFKGKRVPAYGRDATHTYIAPPHDPYGAVQKIRNDHEKAVYVTTRPPQPVRVPTFVDATVHAVPGFAPTLDHKMLFHGLDLDDEADNAPDSTSPGQTAGTSFRRTPNGKFVFIKPTLLDEGLETLIPLVDEFSTAKREGLFQQIASVFGLGHFVPLTSVFVHPITHVEHSVQEVVPHSRHAKDRSSNSILTKLGDEGTLHRLALLDYVAGNTDRGYTNYLLSDKGIHLIDNSNTLVHGGGPLPDYLLRYHDQKGEDTLAAQAHPAAVESARALNTESLASEMSRAGVPYELIRRSIAKAMRAKKVAHEIQNPTVAQLLGVQ